MLLELASLLGWFVFLGYIFALLNFFIKYINRKYILKMPKENKLIINIYKKIMKFITKNHKIVGSIISLTIIFHFIIMAGFVEISLIGLISLALMLSIFILGTYGAIINKNYKGSWLKIHRLLAFLLLISIIIHIS